MSKINTDSPFTRRIAQLKAELTASIGKPRRLLTDAEVKEMAERAEAEKSPLHRLVEAIHKGSPENTFSE